MASIRHRTGKGAKPRAAIWGGFDRNFCASARWAVRVAEAAKFGPFAPQHAHKLVRQSDLPPVDAAATDLLIGLVKAAGGDAYLSGDGADGYQEEPKYAAAGLGFRLQGFTHPDTGAPAGLSAVDALMRGVKIP